MAVTATATNFDEQVAQDKLTIVDFWAPWCAPCKMMEPVIDQLDEQFRDRVTFVRFNVDDSQEIAARYHVLSVPSLVVFNDGVAKEKLTGLFSRDKLARYVEQKIKQLQ
ncbi:thioredoxin [Paucilactobacillus vaccinostercus DSM 20634]|jgi:thioredoxin 1|uniref:Thioredoxin n=1 Tax=Paucilactobacillus vaccinostercus DSM 20634 TaxID=1423813 RepID=A0A0R2A2N0_9LACO|nr:thioredoxin [Paucilactobacillus vaccinostercus]KRM61614.1 thioredoxin [Paucilactobacillus vaccinostercus DSM 20634]RRG10619.1 MAG: thioredoxin [Lactobacillus sp.]